MAIECISERQTKIICRDLMAVENTELIHHMSYKRKSMYKQLRKIIPAALTPLIELIQQLIINSLTV